jgi:hypothetical protein
MDKMDKILWSMYHKNIKPSEADHYGKRSGKGIVQGGGED